MIEYNSSLWYLTLFLLNLFNFISGIDIDLYPWEYSSTSDRNDLILDNLRQNINLIVYENLISNSFHTETEKLYVRNIESQVFELAIGKEQELLETFKNLQTRPEFINNLLKGVCSAYHEGYWSYEWCHRSEVSQFHIEGSHENGKVSFLKNPIWSLGKFKRSKIIRENGDQFNESARIVKIVDKYTNGQICHEINSPRSTNVVLKCCDEKFFHYNSFTKLLEKSNADIKLEYPMAKFQSIHEPSTCAYEVTICTPLLCDPSAGNDEELPEPERMDDAGDEIKVSEKSHTKESSPSTLSIHERNSVSKGFLLTNVFQAFRNNCLMKMEEWWTYELCFFKGLRQMRFDFQNVQNEKTGTVTQKQVLVNQYILGTPPSDVEAFFSDEANLYSLVKKKEFLDSWDEKKLKKSLGMYFPAGFVSFDSQPSYLEMVFQNGTPCDLAHVNRSTSIRVYCGAKNQIVSIVEDATCHYTVKVELQKLCDLESFRVETELSKSISFKAEYTDDDEEEEEEEEHDQEEEQQEKEDLVAEGKDGDHLKETKKKQQATEVNESEVFIEAEVNEEGSIEQGMETIYEEVNQKSGEEENNSDSIIFDTIDGGVISNTFGQRDAYPISEENPLGEAIETIPSDETGFDTSTDPDENQQAAEPTMDSSSKPEDHQADHADLAEGQIFEATDEKEGSSEPPSQGTDSQSEG